MQAVPLGSGEHVTFPGRVAVALGPIRTSPRVCAVEEVTTVVPPTTTESITLKLAFFTLNVAAPVLTVIVTPLSVARLAPPYPEHVVSVPFGREVDPQDMFAVPALLRVVDTVDPAVRDGTIPQALTHFAFPSGHRPNMRN